MSDNKDTHLEFKSISSKKPIAPKFIAYLAALGYFVESVIAVVLLMRWSFKTDIILIGVFLGIILVLFCMHTFFEWFMNGKVTIEGSKISYSFEDVVAVMGKATVTETITEVTKVVKKRNSIVVYGTVLHKEPMLQPKTKKKAELLGHFENEDELLSMLNNLK